MLILKVDDLLNPRQHALKALATLKALSNTISSAQSVNLALVVGSCFVLVNS